MSEAAPDDHWDAYLRQDFQAIPEDDLRRLDAAEAIVHRHFGISPAYYVRANEYPHAAKLADVIAALVLKRSEWEQVPSPVSPHSGD
jgi:hypothetical protein